MKKDGSQRLMLTVPLNEGRPAMHVQEKRKRVRWIASVRYEVFLYVSAHRPRCNLIETASNASVESRQWAVTDWHWRGHRACSI